MNVIDALKSRHSCRTYEPRPVSKEIVLKVLEAAIHAPSWGNTQPWEIYVATGEVLDRLRLGYLANREKGIPGNPSLSAPKNWPPALRNRYEELMARRSQLAGITRDDSAGRQTMLLANYRLFDAPTVIYLCMDRSLSSGSIFDLGLLAQSIMLAAKHYGLDTIPAVMLTAYQDLVRAELEIPDNLSVIIGIALGYENLHDAESKFRSSRSPLDEVVHLKGF